MAVCGGVRTVLVFVALASARVQVHARSVSVSVSAPWSHSPFDLYIGAAEQLASAHDADRDAMWTFLERIGEMRVASGGQHINRSTVVAAAAAAAELSPLERRSFGLSMRLGEYLPNVRMLRSLSSPSGAGTGNSSAGDASTNLPCSPTDGGALAWARVSVGDGSGGGSIACTVDQLESLLAGTADAKEEVGFVPAIDHVYPIKAESKSKTDDDIMVLLTATPATTAFAGFHKVLAAKAAAGGLKYTLRLAPPAVSVDEPAGGTALPLAGYGVALDLKKLEYKTLDSAQMAGGNDTDSTVSAKAAQDDDDDLDGFVFSRLLERVKDEDDQAGKSGSSASEVRAGLESFRQQLLAARAKTDDIKVWDLKEIGLATVQMAQEASGTGRDPAAAGDPLRQLRELAQNFPLYAKELTRRTQTRVGDDLRKELGKTTKYLAAYQNMLLVNGIAFDLQQDTFNVFSLLKTVRHETQHMKQLRALPLSPDALQRVLALSASGAGAHGQAGGGSSAASQIRVDVRKGAKGAITYMNNIEKDAMYKAWSADARVLLKPSWQLHQVRRNLFTLVLVIDPTSTEGLMAVMTCSQMIRQQIPIRVGIILAKAKDQAQALDMEEETESAVAGEDDSASDPVTAAQIGKLFAAAKKWHGAQAAITFLEQLAQTAMSGGAGGQAAMLAQMMGGAAPPPAGGGKIGKTEAVAAFAAAAAAAKRAWTDGKFKAEAEKVLGGTLGDKAVAKMEAFVAKKGLPANSFTLNGILHNSLDIQRELMQTLGTEQQTLRNMVAKGEIGSKTNVYNKVLSGPSVYPRFAPFLIDSRSLSARAARTEPEKLAALLNATVSNPGANGNETMAMIVSVDLSTKTGTKLAAEALKFRAGVIDDEDEDEEAEQKGKKGKKGKKSKKGKKHAATKPKSVQAKPVAVRVAIVHTPSSSSEASATRVPLAALLTAIIESDSTAANLTDAAAFLDKISATEADDDAAWRATATKAASQRIGGDGSVAKMLLSATKLSMHDLAHRGIVARAALHVSDTGAEAGTDAGAAVPTAADGTDCIVFAGTVALRSCSLDAADFSLVERFVKANAVKNVKKAVAAAAAAAKASDQGSATLSCAQMMQVTHMLSRHQQSNRMPPLPALKAPLSTITSGDAEDGRNESLIEIVAILDPLSEACQRGTDVLLLLRDELRQPITVHLTPKLEITEFPVKSFYRFAVGSESDARVASESDSGAYDAVFDGLPPDLLLTLKIHAPESWDVQALGWGGADPDNLRENTHQRLSYTLNSVLLAGQCVDATSAAMLAAPPSGLQLRLAAAADPDQHYGTLVMSTMGYFQFRATPGMWLLGLAPGRSDELFTVAQTSADAGDSDVAPQLVFLRDFTGTLELLRVRKRPGHEDEQLLAEPGDEVAEEDKEKGVSRGNDDAEDSNSGVAKAKGDSKTKETAKAKSKGKVKGKGKGKGTASALWSAFSSLLGGKKPVAPRAPPPGDTIHVFSLATGKLYERFLKLMMLSSSRRASMPVKFWLLENFLSPEFKRVVPQLAKEFGFQVEFVTYKWPNWLRGQTEKQRIIWGYKILFLDVLFPLDVKKVIYVDADQIVRADLKELWDLDLEGHAYGYTPFCTSRKETLGYQFWRDGYWKDHLRGRPYHISALYVVDLVRFRQQTVGDKLRALYDQLSRDKNSLSNLDQDLPNYAQHMVPIYSLPQDWLWCESWCSDATKATSKTIDLCNNPKHKEPKLDMAKRVIDGPLFKESWIELDNIVQAAERRIDDNARGNGVDAAEERNEL